MKYGDTTTLWSPDPDAASITQKEKMALDVWKESEDRNKCTGTVTISKCDYENKVSSSSHRHPLFRRPLNNYSLLDFIAINYTVWVHLLSLSFDLSMTFGLFFWRFSGHQPEDQHISQRELGGIAREQKLGILVTKKMTWEDTASLSRLTVILVRGWRLAGWALVVNITMKEENMKQKLM